MFRPRGRNLGVVNEQSTLHSNDPIASGRKVKYEDVIYWGISCGCDRSVGALQARTVRRKGKTLEGEGSGGRREPTLKRSIPRWLNAPRTLDIFERRALLAPLERNPYPTGENSACSQYFCQLRGIPRESSTSLYPGKKIVFTERAV